MYFFNQYFHLINLPPLLIVTIFFIIGIIWHTQLIFFLIISALLLCCFLYTYIQQLPFPKELILFSFFLCAGSYLHQKELQSYDDFYTLTDNKKFNVTGTVIDKNEIIVQHKKTTVTTLLLDIIATNTVSQKSNKTMVFYTESNNNAVVGDTITFYDVYCKKPSNESFQRYQIKEQIIATIFNKITQYTVDHHPSWSLRHWIWQQKKRLLDSLSFKFSQPCFRFFSSLFLGNRACIKTELEETNEQFKIWGISHFLARSGLHLALFILIWQTIFCIIPLPILIKQIIISMLSCIYFILTWTSAPFTRSFALFLFNKICLFTHKSFHLLHYLTLVCFGFLLYCPLYLFFLDFQLSFALTFALAWFSQLSGKYTTKS